VKPRGVAVAFAGLVVDAGTGQSRPLPDVDITHAGHVAAAALDLGCGSVLVLDRLVSTSWIEHTPDQIVEQVTGWPAAWRVLGSAGVTLVFLDVDAGGQVAGPWQGLDALELVRALRTFERLVGVPWLDSVGRTAERLIASTHPRERGGVRLDEQPVTPAPCDEGNLELPFSWVRPLNVDERAAKHCHAFDANAQYLGAWIVAELGIGAPERFKSFAVGAGVAVPPGVWRVKPGELVDGLCGPLPVPWRVGAEWVTTPTFVRAIEILGRPPAILEAWVWPAKSRYLRGAGEALRDARARCIDELEAATAELEAWTQRSGPTDEGVGLLRRHVVADVVLDAVKAIYRVETGRFNMAGRDERSGWRRPDWGHTVRAVARCNLHRRLEKLGAVPFAIATDGLLFVDDEPDGLVFAERIGLPVGKGLGQYSHDGSIELGPVLDEVDGQRSAVAAFAGFRKGHK
jgi:hypothetical protein